MNLEKDGLIVTRSAFLTHERGVLSNRPFAKGALLFTISGPVQREQSKYSLSIGIEQHIEPQKDGRADFGHYINHSCDPTALVRIVRTTDPFIEVVARRDLMTGEELTIDYASIEYEVTVKGTKCQCRSSLCRGEIHGFKELPQEVIERYRKEGLISDHLLLLGA
jgi:hypothetical protein